MSSSPYTPASVRDYMRHHKVEELINSTVNNLLRSKPEDPYGFIIGELSEKASSDIKILDIRAIECLAGDNLPAIKLYAKVLYMNREVRILLEPAAGILSDDNMIYDGDEAKYAGTVHFYRRKRCIERLSFSQRKACRKNYQL